MLGAYSSVAMGVAAGVVTALDRMPLYTAILFGSTGITYGLTRGLVAVFPCIEAVAAGWALGSLLLMVLMMIAAHHVMGRPRWSGLVHAARVLAPLAYATPCALVAERLAGAFPLGAWPRTILAEVLLGVLAAPLGVRLLQSVRSR